MLTRIMDPPLSNKTGKNNLIYLILKKVKKETYKHLQVLITNNLEV